MKNLHKIAVLMLAVGLVACGDKKKDEPGNGGGGNDTPASDAVEVTISTSSIETKAAMLEFKGNDKMNVFPKTYNRVDAPNIVDGVVATFDGSQWSMSPKVYINPTQKNAFVYAVAPYDPSYTDAERIPVDLTRQVDLLYSGAFVPASLTSPNIKLTMKHALSLLSFNIVPVNYSGKGELTSLSLEGENIYLKGVMDASSGKIALTEKGRFEQKFNKATQEGGWTSDIPGLWTLPFNTKAGYATLTAVIDGKSYQILLPEVEVQQGWQYIFRLALTNSGLEFDPSKTETRSLNVTDDQTQQFMGYGRIALIASGAWLNSPTLLGDAIFGTLSTPKGNSSYSSSVKVEGLSAGQQVVVESWNTTGFKIETLDGIDTIDISQYE